MPVKPKPDGYHTATPYLIVHGAAAAIEFYKQVFDAVELMRLPGPDGRIGHAEIKIGDSPIMLADEFPDMGYLGPKTRGGATGSMLLYVDDAVALFDRALEAGAELHKPMAEQFYGDRSGTIIDPWGHMWTLATHIEDVPPEEMQRRMEAFMKEQE